MILLALALSSALAGAPAALVAENPASNPFAAPAAPWAGSALNVPSDPAKEARMPRVSAQSLKAMMRKMKGLIVVDTRDQAAYQTSHVAGAIDIPLMQFSTMYKQLPKDRLIALYCT